MVSMSVAQTYNFLDFHVSCMVVGRSCSILILSLGALVMDDPAGQGQGGNGQQHPRKLVALHQGGLSCQLQQQILQSWKRVVEAYSHQSEKRTEDVGS